MPSNYILLRIGQTLVQKTTSCHRCRLQQLLYKQYMRCACTGFTNILNHLRNLRETHLNVFQYITYGFSKPKFWHHGRERAFFGIKCKVALFMHGNE